MTTDYSNIIETLKVIKAKKKGGEYLDFISQIINLLNEEETGRFVTADYRKNFAIGQLKITVTYGKIL